MRFDFTEEQREIKETARDLLAARCGTEKILDVVETGAYEDRLWQEMCDLGWPGIAIDEEHGGLGLGQIELCLLAEEAGYALAGSPLLSSLNAGAVLAGAALDETYSEWLVGLAAGRITGGTGLAHGRESRVLVPDGHSSEIVLLVGPGEFHVVTQTATDGVPIVTVDRTRQYASFDRNAGEALAVPGALAMRKVGVGIAAELVGVSQRALDLTITYVKEREQFGRPVGSFQAVAHRCAEMLIGVESARSSVYYAAWALDSESDSLSEACSLAATVAAKAAREVTASAIQAHGGIGFSWESPVSWLFKRAQLDAVLLGSASALQRTLLAETYPNAFMQGAGANPTAGPET